MQRTMTVAEVPTVYFEEMLDPGPFKRRFRLIAIPLVLLAPLLDYLASFAGSPVQPEIWLPTMPFSILVALLLPKFALAPHPFIRVVGSHLEIQKLRLPPRRIPVDTIVQLKARMQRNADAVEINRESFFTGFRLKTERPYELVDAIERAQRDQRTLDVQLARELAPGFRTDAVFTFERRLTVREALVSKRTFALIPILMFGLPAVIDSDDWSISWIGVGIMLTTILLTIGAALLRRNTSISVDAEELEVRGVFLRPKTISTLSIKRAEAIDLGMFRRELAIHYGEDKNRKLVVPIPEPDEAAATIRRSIAYFAH